MKSDVRLQGVPTQRRSAEDLPSFGLGPSDKGQEVGGLGRRQDADLLPVDNEAVMLFFGELGANEMSDVALPLPNGLQAAGVKRITATLAWLSPVNWRHREYRRAALSFAKPQGMTELPSPLDVPAVSAKRGTVQHLVWEIGRAVPFGQGDTLSLTVRCSQQAGGLGGERVPFAVALSLWVAPELGVDVYTQVRDQVRSRVGVAPR